MIAIILFVLLFLVVQEKISSLKREIRKGGQVVLADKGTRRYDVGVVEVQEIILEVSLLQQVKNSNPTHTD